MAKAVLLVIVIICATTLFHFGQSEETTSTSTTPVPTLEEIFTCNDLGFEGATLNKCGYCVEGNTELAANHGVDCAATCDQAFLDCAGTCNGNAYVDECTGQCILGPQSPPVSGHNSTNARLRDCRGLCPMIGQTVDTSYTLDNCSVCVVQKNLAISNVTTFSNGTILSNGTTYVNGTTFVNGTSTGNSSLYKDCSGTCYRPATITSMAVNNSNTCFHCVGPYTSSKVGDYKDDCGNCKSENIPCECKKEQQDMCGRCIDQNTPCLTIISASPAVIPGGTMTEISVIGVALQSKHHTVCLFIRQDLTADGKDEEKFPAEYSESNLICKVTLTEGNYRLYLAVEKNANEMLSQSNTSVPFIAYSKAASITAMRPSSFILTEDTNNVTVLFTTQNIERINVINCSIAGPGYSGVINVLSPNITNGITNCTFPVPANSSTANVSVSFDGVTNIAGPFPFTFYAPAPQVTDKYFLHEGTSIVIFFKNNINATNNLMSCNNIFTKETVAGLGERTNCTWITKRQLIVTLDVLANTNTQKMNEITDLYFLDNVLFSENESYPLAARNLSLHLIPSNEIPKAILIGPKRVPPCGTFTLDGHQSLGIQSRRVRFTWNVTTAEEPVGNLTNSTDNVNNSLISFLQDASRRNLASIVIDVDLLEPEVPYNFTLTVSNGNITDNLTSSAHLVVIQDLLYIPVVVIEPSKAHYPHTLSLDKRFTLNSYMSMPACQHEIYALEYRWSVSSPKVKFDLKQINKESYTVEPWTLFPTKNVTFTVKVTMNNNPNLTSEDSITLDVVSNVVKLALIGGYQRTVGNSSGILVLNVSQSYFADSPAMPLVYRWVCTDQEGNPCYNYDPESNDVLLLPYPVSRSKTLDIPTKRLNPGSTLHFNVQAFSPLNVSQVSETRSVVIRVLNGSTPMVSIDSMMVRDTNIQMPELEDISYIIPPMNDVIVTANIFHSGPLAQIVWFIPGFKEDLAPYSINSTNESGNFTQATVQIQRDHLFPNGLYQINVTVIAKDGGTGWAVSSFMVLSPVVGCQVVIEEYEAFEMISVYLEGCSVSDVNKPLSYQMYYYHNSNLISISKPQFHLPLEVMGPPALNLTSAENVFAVKVCDASHSCWWFNSSAVEVGQSVDMQASAAHVTLMANVAKQKGDYLSCLRYHSLYLLDITPTYRIKYGSEVDSQIGEALLCARRAAEIQCNGTECFDNLFTLLLAIPIENMPGRDFVLLEIVSKAVNRLEFGNLTLSSVGAQDAILVLENIYKYNVSANVTAKLVNKLEKTIQRILVRGFHPGQTVLLVDSTGAPQMLLNYQLPEEVFKLTLPGGNKTVGIELGKDLNKKFESWKCQGVNGSLCKGIVSDLQFYPKHLYRPFKIDDNNTVTDVVEVMLRNPSTGELFVEKSKFYLRLSANYTQMYDNLTYDCYFWDEKEEKWSMDGVETDVTNTTTFFCKSKRLSAIYAVIGTIPGLSTAAIVGIVLGILAALAIVAIISFMAYKKARTKTMRVSMSKGYNPNVQ